MYRAAGPGAIRHRDQPGLDVPTYRVGEVDTACPGTDQAGLLPGRQLQRDEALAQEQVRRFGGGAPMPRRRPGAPS